MPETLTGIAAAAREAEIAEKLQGYDQRMRQSIVKWQHWSNADDRAKHRALLEEREKLRPQANQGEGNART